jgi:hypothetical protein
MRQGTKRSLALLLCLVLLGTLLPALPAQAEEIEIIPIETPIEAEPVDEEEIVLIGEEPAEPDPLNSGTRHWEALLRDIDKNKEGK